MNIFTENLEKNAKKLYIKCTIYRNMFVMNTEKRGTGSSKR